MEQLDYDSKRTEYLTHFGFKVLRFWNSDIFLHIDIVLEQIRQLTSFQTVCEETRSHEKMSEKAECT